MLVSGRVPYPFSHNHGFVENGGLEDDWLASFWGPFSTSMIMGGRVMCTCMNQENEPEENN